MTFFLLFRGFFLSLPELSEELSSSDESSLLLELLLLSPLSELLPDEPLLESGDESAVEEEEDFPSESLSFSSSPSSESSLLSESLILTKEK